ncbi:hypothetical protein F4780DRAFT_552097 [Xylariomycetidae sp. FL0641]|nr:hypothetical protein F4780DRAFT_552097 [Xylariomycetidae sp. FL0641]
MADLTGYHPLYPTDVPTGEELKGFIANFYQISDDPTKNEEWVDSFFPDAECIMGDTVARGIDEIRKLRKGMWDVVSSRRHRPMSVFPASFGDDENIEYMLHGDLHMETKDGMHALVAWAARAVLRKDPQGKLKYASYQVYLNRMKFSPHPLED